MQQFFGISAAILILAGSAPYARDVYKGRAHPSRATRLMLFILILLSILQSHDLGSRWSLLFFIGELIQSLVMLILSIKHGIGGLSKSDKYCYALLAFNLTFWLITKNSFIALLLTITGDIIACIPTYLKLKKFPTSETSLFWQVGTLAAFLSLISEKNISLGTTLLPFYLFLINGFFAILITSNNRKYEKIGA